MGGKGSIVTVILLNGWILPIGGASAVEGGATLSEYYTSYNNIDSYNRATRLVIVQIEDTQIKSKYRKKFVLHK